MSAGQLTIPTSNQTLFCGGVVSSAPLQVRDLAGGQGGGGAGLILAASTATNGGFQEGVGGVFTGSNIAGGVVNERIAFISPFVPGAAYQQWAVAKSNVGPAFLPYTKTTAGTQVLTTDPSADGANWTPIGLTSILTNGTIGVERFAFDGSGPAVINWLSEGYLLGGSAARLVGRDVNYDAQFVVNGLLQGEGLRVINSINHPNDPSIGAGTGTYELGKDYYILNGVPTATTPGAARPAQYGGGVFPAFVPGQSTIYTLASDPGAMVVLTRTDATALGPAVGTLTAPLASKAPNSFVVQSLDATGTLATTDVGTFHWWIVNPTW